jgi:hypothetical protein
MPWVALIADRHGLAPRRPLAAAGPAARPGGHGRAVDEGEAMELLRAVAEGVGLLRVRGDRLEATSLRNAWSQIDESLRAGLTFAACATGFPSRSTESKR